MQPLQYPIYKGTGGNYGAIQFNLSLPHYYKEKERSFDGLDHKGLSIFERSETGRLHLKEGWKTREGAVFMEITSTKGKNIYDWANKITLALSVNDLSQVLLTLLTGQECSIMHDPGAKTEAQGAKKKWLKISSPGGTAKGAIVSVTQQAGGEKISHTVPMSGHEVVALKALLERAITQALNW